MVRGRKRTASDVDAMLELNEQIADGSPPDGCTQKFDRPLLAQRQGWGFWPTAGSVFRAEHPSGQFANLSLCYDASSQLTSHGTLPFTSVRATLDRPSSQDW